MKNNKHILILNNGSSSLKFAVFSFAKDKSFKEILSGSLVLINKQKTILTWQKGRDKKQINYHKNFNLANWWHYILDVIADYQIIGVGVRLVHGGEEFTNTIKVDKKFLNKIVKYNDLAPLHNPPALDLIKLVKKTWPRVKIAASFDTAWYQDIKPTAYLYSLPLKYKQSGIRKFGFHGLSHEAATQFAAKTLNKKASKLKTITCHLGSGNSLTWYLNGQVKDTTMGFSPNEGLTMATRSGDLPPSVVFYLVDKFKLSLEQIQKTLNEKSGLLGLCGLADLRDVLIASGYRVPGYKSKSFNKQQRQRAKIALAVYLYDIQRYLASYIGMSKKLDAIVFTGRVGTDSSLIRRLVLKNLSLPAKCKVLVAPTGEMENLANKTLQCLNQK